MARILSHDVIAKASDRAPSSTRAERQTLRSLRVSRSRSCGVEADSTVDPTPGVEFFVIGKFGRKALPVLWKTREDNLAYKLWRDAGDHATRTPQCDGEDDNTNRMVTGNR